MSLLWRWRRRSPGIMPSMSTFTETTLWRFGTDNNIGISRIIFLCKIKNKIPWCTRSEAIIPFRFSVITSVCAGELLYNQYVAFAQMRVPKINLEHTKTGQTCNKHYQFSRVTSHLLDFRNGSPILSCIHFHHVVYSKLYFIQLDSVT